MDVLKAVAQFERHLLIDRTQSGLKRQSGGEILGYSRCVVRGDGSLLCVYYYNYGSDQERFIAASIFDV